MEIDQTILTFENVTEEIQNNTIGCQNTVTVHLVAQ